MLNILVYTGSDTLSAACVEFVGLPQPTQVVLHVADKYLKKRHHIFTDGYYTSIPLANSLYQRKTAFTGTIMRNRVGLPEEFRKPAKKLGQGLSRIQKDGVGMEGTTSVIMISTESPASMTRVQLSRNRGETQKLLAVKPYHVNERRGPSRPKQRLLLLHPKEPKMVEETFLLAHRGHNRQQLHSLPVSSTGKSDTPSVSSTGDWKCGCAVPLYHTTTSTSWSPTKTTTYRGWWWLSGSMASAMFQGSFPPQRNVQSAVTETKTIDTEVSTTARHAQVNPHYASHHALRITTPFLFTSSKSCWPITKPMNSQVSMSTTYQSICACIQFHPSSHAPADSK